LLSSVGIGGYDTLSKLFYVRANTRVRPYNRLLFVDL